MRSIRRSLLGYLLLLLAASLGAVAAFADRFAAAAVSRRESSEAERIEQSFKVRQNDARAQFDADLLSDAKVLAGQVHRHTKHLLDQDRDFRGRPGGKMGALEPPAVLRAGEEDARQYRLRSALLECCPAPGALPAFAAVLAVQPRIPDERDPRRSLARPYLNWVEFEGPRALARIQESLRTEFVEDAPGEQCQFTLVAAFPGAGARRVVGVRGGQLPRDLPVDGRFLAASPDPEPVLDDVVVPGVGPCRHAAISTLPGGRPVGFFVWLPPPPEPAAVPNFTRYQITRAPDMILRVVVQVARPYSDLDARLAADQKERDEQLARVRAETRAELNQLRARLVLIGSGTFAALVLGGWLIVARGLSPLRVLSDAVSRVSEKDFRLPVVPAELGRELAPIHARLTQTLTLLQRAFAREKQAVADISHELRTPIASLLATIDVALRKDRTPDQYREALRECRLISKQLGQLVERIMTLASLDAGNDHTSVSRVDGAELADGCAAVIRPLAAVHDVTLSVAHDGEVALETDAGKLREVLTNLLHNAVEYNKPGGTIELAVRRAGGEAVFEVRDTGIGMTPEVQDRIFERFYRADASRTATGVHAGLGLAIVKEYVARLRGTIAVESVPGAGTTFRVALPLAPVAEPASPAGAPPAPPPSGDRAKARGAVHTVS